MKKLAYLFILSLLVAGCNQSTPTNTQPAQTSQKPSEPSPTDTLKEIDKSLSNTGKITKASDVKFEIVDFDYKLPKTISDVCKSEPKDGEIGCPTIAIQFANTQPSFIGDVINRTISDDDNPQKIKFRQSLDNFAQSQLDDEFTLGYSMNTTLERLPDHKNLVQVAIYNDTYMGGAHGMQTGSYLLFDMDLQSQVKLSDLMTSDGDIFTPLNDAFMDYLASIEITSEKDIKEYQETWQFYVSENVYFNDTGLVFVYNPYELGAYAQGFIELTIPYDKLTGVIKANYL